MARMYKTAGANPLDYMYRINTPLMERVINANDGFIDENMAELGTLDKAATTFPYLQADESRAKAIAEQYSKQIDEATTAIKNDPANWRKQLDPIRGISKELQNSYRVGEISKIAGNYSKYKQVSDTIDEQVKEFGKSGKGISADRAKAYKEYFLKSFTKANPNGTAYDAKTGDYNAINVYDPMANIDIRKQLSDELDKMKANGEVKITDQITGAGEYFNKTTQKWESITPDRILRIVTDRLNNPQLMNYLKQDSQVGAVTGVFDQDPDSPNYGRFINPYSHDKVAINSSEQGIIDGVKKQIAGTKNNNAKEALQKQLDAYVKQINERTSLNWNKDSYLAPIMRGIVDQYSHETTWSENDLSANSIWSTKYSQSQANARNNASIGAANARQQRGFQNAKDMYDAKRADDLINKVLDFNFGMARDLTKGTTKKTTGTTPVKDKNGKVIGTLNGAAINPEKTNTDNSVIGSIETTPFWWQSKDKTKLTSTLNEEVGVHEGELAQLEKTLGELKKTQPDNKILITHAENRIANTKAKLNTLQSQRNTAIDYAIDEWKKRGTTKNGYNEILQPIASMLSKTNYNEGSERVVRQFISGKLKIDADKANAELIKMEAKKKQLDNPMFDISFKKFMKEEYYPAVYRKTQAETLLNGGQKMFNNNVKPFADTKLETAKKESTNRSSVIQTTKAQDGTILDMINADPSRYKVYDEHGNPTKISFEHGTATTNKDKFKIIGVATTTGIGDKGIEVSAIMNGKRVIISPKDDGNFMQDYLAQQFKASKDKNVQAVGSILATPTAGTLSDMFSEMKMNTNTSFGTTDAWTYRTIPNPANELETTRVRSRNVSTGGGEPKWEFQVEIADENAYYGIISNSVGQGTRLRQKGSDYSYDESGKFTGGFVPLTSIGKDGSHNTKGIYHNLQEVISIFPSK